MFAYLWIVLVEVCVYKYLFDDNFTLLSFCYCSWGDDEYEYDKGRGEDDGYGELEYVSAL